MRKEKLDELTTYIQELKTIKKTLMKEEFVYDSLGNPMKRKGFLQVEKYLCELANGRVIPRERIVKGTTSGNASIVVPFTKDNQIVLVVQPRNHTKESVCVELPAGYIEKQESPVDAAKRELVEETGYTSKEMHLLDSFYQDQGCSSAYNYSFVALGCEKVRKQSLDHDEVIRYFECSMDEAFDLIKRGYICDIQSKYTLEKSRQFIKRREKNERI